MDRPTFYTDSKKSIRAGGLLLYKKFDDKIHFLMIKSKYDNEYKYEDFGGRTDIVDSSIEDTIIREVFEESNEQITREQSKKAMDNLDGGYNVYIPICKYLLIIRKTNDDFKPKDFGDREIHDNLERTVEWFPIDEWNDKSVHFRLGSNHVHKAIMDLLS